MRRLLTLTFAIASTALIPPMSFGQSVVTDPVGFTTSTLLSNSDSFISLPFVRPPIFVGGIQSASGNTITVSGNPWTANQFVYAAGSQPNHYYALIGPASTSNPKEGHTYPILGNGTNTLTVELSQDNLVGIPANAQVSIIPNWTLATAFPASDQNVSFTPTISTSAYKTQIRVPDASAAGTNLPYTTYFFSNNVNGTTGNVGWRLLGDNLTNHGDDPLLPDSYFVVRNLNGAPTLPLVSLGSVLLKKLTVPLMTSTSTAQDNPVGILRPLDVSLNATGLKATDGSFVPNDQLLVFNNAQAGFDKAPSVIYYQDPAAPESPWRAVGDPVSDRGGDAIRLGTGFIIRKAATAGGQVAFWTNNFPVQAVSVVSRKTHGAAGDFDINLPVTGAPGVECRGTSTDYKLIFTFPVPVTFSGVAVTSGVTTGVTAVTNANVVTVNVTGATNVQRITVTLLDVNDGTNTNDVAVRMGILTADTNSSGTVSGSDISQTKAQAGQPVTAANFRQDVNLSGTMTASDIALVKSKSGSTLPPP